MQPSKRLVACFIAATGMLSLLAVAPAFGQALVGTPPPYGLDPYKPSDAEWLRKYGAVLVAQTPLLELGRLDPYKPSDAALIRQVGALPLCCPDWPWTGATFGPLMPLRARGVPASHAAVTTPSHLSAQTMPLVASSPTAGLPPSAVASSPPSRLVATAIRPQSNDGVWIRYDGQTWISAGRALALADSEFERVGESSGFQVYRLAGVDGVIYMRTRDNKAAPYRLKP